MKFVVSSMELLGHLQAISRVISNKNTLPILDNFLFSLEDGILDLARVNAESFLFRLFHSLDISEIIFVLPVPQEEN